MDLSFYIHFDIYGRHYPIGSSSQGIISLLRSLQIDFFVKDLGSLHYFLGIEVVHFDSGLMLIQQQCILNLLKWSDMLYAKHISSPMSNAHHLSLYEDDPFHDLDLYRHIVGTLQCLTFA